MIPLDVVAIYIYIYMKLIQIQILETSKADGSSSNKDCENIAVYSTAEEMNLQTDRPIKLLTN